MTPFCIEDILRRDVRAGARLLRWIDDGLPEAQATLKGLYPHTGNASIVGITGSPGAGKSTLVNGLIKHYRSQNQTVAVVAIDPSSPFSGGAILGDRIRMQEHATDAGVFIRSFATRGHLGGLSNSTADVLHVLDAMGFDIILVETVGVGQDEVEIQQVAHSVVVVLAPGMGDEVQAIKAGILEIADVFVINKADRDGVDRTLREIQQMIELSHDTPTPTQIEVSGAVDARFGNENLDRRLKVAGWIPRVIKTQAVQGEGLPQLFTALQEHRTEFLQALSDPAFVRGRLRQEFLGIFRRRLWARGWSYLVHEAHLQQILERLAQHSHDPYSLAEEAVAALGRD